MPERTSQKVLLWPSWLETLLLHSGIVQLHFPQYTGYSCTETSSDHVSASSRFFPDLSFLNSRNNLKYRAPKRIARRTTILYIFLKYRSRKCEMQIKNRTTLRRAIKEQVWREKYADGIFFSSYLFLYWPPQCHTIPQFHLHLLTRLLLNSKLLCLLRLLHQLSRFS